MNLSEIEYYQLRCCTSKTILEVNNEKIVFEFTGKAFNENIPDKFFNTIISKIKNISKNTTTGCFELIDVTDTCDPVMFRIVKWETFFVEVDHVKTCEECLPDPEIIEGIGLRKFYFTRPENPCDYKSLDFADLMFRDALLRFEGIKLCCPPNKMKVIKEARVHELDLITDKRRCCPPCVQFSLFFPSGLDGTYSYRNCNGDVIVEPITTTVDTTIVVCGCVNQLPTDIVFTGTGTGFTATPLGIPCIS